MNPTVMSVDVRLTRSDREVRQGILTDVRRTAKEWAGESFGWSFPEVVEVLYVRGAEVGLRIADASNKGRYEGA